MPVAIAVIGAVANVAFQMKAAKEQKKAAKKAQQQQELEAARSRRRAAREAQIKRAQALASAEAQGVAGSSAAQGGIGSIGSQAGEALGFSTQMSGLSRDIGRHQSRANQFGAFANIGSNLFSFGTTLASQGR